MKTLPIIQDFKKIFSFLFLIFLIHQEGVSQKNVVKFTPVKLAFGKVNVSYERKITKSLSLFVDAQHWFIKDRAVGSQPLFNFDFSIWSDNAPPVLESNKGIRLSLGLRGYSFLKEKKNAKRYLYFGGGGFVGQHKISMERKSYFVPQQDGWFGGVTPAETHPRLSGAVNLISGGVYFDFGIQFRFQNNISIDLGLVAGRAWINREKDYLTLYDYTPYNLEPEKESLQEGFVHGISGPFFQPIFNVGYRF